MRAITGKVVRRQAQMWSREVFDIVEGNKLLAKSEGFLSEPGVYDLYRDDHRFYVGKTGGKLFSQIRRHANRPTDRYYNFWNFFSAFVVPNKQHSTEVEGILISAMPTAARHRIGFVTKPSLNP